MGIFDEIAKAANKAKSIKESKKNISPGGTVGSIIPPPKPTSKPKPTPTPAPTPEFVGPLRPPKQASKPTSKPPTSTPKPKPTLKQVPTPEFVGPPKPTPTPTPEFDLRGLPDYAPGTREMPPTPPIQPGSGVRHPSTITPSPSTPAPTDLLPPSFQPPAPTVAITDTSIETARLLRDKYKDRGIEANIVSQGDNKYKVTIGDQPALPPEAMKPLPSVYESNYDILSKKLTTLTDEYNAAKTEDEKEEAFVKLAYTLKKADVTTTNLNKTKLTTNNPKLDSTLRKYYEGQILTHTFTESDYKNLQKIYNDTKNQIKEIEAAPADSLYNLDNKTYTKKETLAHLKNNLKDMRIRITGTHKTIHIDPSRDSYKKFLVAAGETQITARSLSFTKPDDIPINTWENWINQAKLGRMSTSNIKSNIINYRIKELTLNKPTRYNLLTTTQYKSIMTDLTTNKITEQEAIDKLESTLTQTLQSKPEMQWKGWAKQNLKFKNPDIEKDINKYQGYYERVESLIKQPTEFKRIQGFDSSYTKSIGLSSDMKKADLIAWLEDADTITEKDSKIRQHYKDTGKDLIGFDSYKKKTDPALYLSMDKTTGAIGVAYDPKRAEQEEWTELGKTSGVIGQASKALLTGVSQAPETIYATIGAPFTEGQTLYDWKNKGLFERGQDFSKAAQTGHKTGDWTDYAGKVAGSPIMTDVVYPAAAGAAFGKAFQLIGKAGTTAGKGTRLGRALLSFSTKGPKVALATIPPMIGADIGYTAAMEKHQKLPPGATIKKLSRLGLQFTSAGVGAKWGQQAKVPRRLKTAVESFKIKTINTKGRIKTHIMEDIPGTRKFLAETSKYPLTRKLGLHTEIGPTTYQHKPISTGKIGKTGRYADFGKIEYISTKGHVPKTIRTTVSSKSQQLSPLGRKFSIEDIKKTPYKLDTKLKTKTSKLKRLVPDETYGKYQKLYLEEYSPQQTAIRPIISDVSGTSKLQLTVAKYLPKTRFKISEFKPQTPSYLKTIPKSVRPTAAAYKEVISKIPKKGIDPHYTTPTRPWEQPGLFPEERFRLQFPSRKLPSKYEMSLAGGQETPLNKTMYKRAFPRAGKAPFYEWELTQTHSQKYESTDFGTPWDDPLYQQKFAVDTHQKFLRPWERIKFMTSQSSPKYQAYVQAKENLKLGKITSKQYQESLKALEPKVSYAGIEYMRPTTQNQWQDMGQFKIRDQPIFKPSRHSKIFSKGKSFTSKDIIQEARFKALEPYTSTKTTRALPQKRLSILQDITSAGKYESLYGVPGTSKGWQTRIIQHQRQGLPIDKWYEYQYKKSHLPREQKTLLDKYKQPTKPSTSKVKTGRALMEEMKQQFLASSRAKPRFTTPTKLNQLQDILPKKTDYSKAIFQAKKSPFIKDSKVYRTDLKQSEGIKGVDYDTSKYTNMSKNQLHTELKKIESKIESITKQDSALQRQVMQGKISKIQFNKLKAPIHKEYDILQFQKRTVKDIIQKPKLPTIPTKPTYKPYQETTYIPTKLISKEWKEYKKAKLPSITEKRLKELQEASLYTQIRKMTPNELKKAISTGKITKEQLSKIKPLRIIQQTLNDKIIETRILTEQGARKYDQQTKQQKINEQFIKKWTDDIYKKKYGLTKEQLKIHKLHMQEQEEILQKELDNYITKIPIDTETSTIDAFRRYRLKERQEAIRKITNDIRTKKLTTPPKPKILKPEIDESKFVEGEVKLFDTIYKATSKESLKKLRDIKKWWQQFEKQKLKQERMKYGGLTREQYAKEQKIKDQYLYEQQKIKHHLSDLQKQNKIKPIKKTITKYEAIDSIPISITWEPMTKLYKKPSATVAKKGKRPKFKVDLGEAIDKGFIIPKPRKITEPKPTEPEPKEIPSGGLMQLQTQKIILEPQKLKPEVQLSKAIQKREAEYEKELSKAKLEVKQTKKIIKKIKYDSTSLVKKLKKFSQKLYTYKQKTLLPHDQQIKLTNWIKRIKQQISRIEQNQSIITKTETEITKTEKDIATLKKLPPSHSRQKAQPPINKISYITTQTESLLQQTQQAQQLILFLTQTQKQALKQKQSLAQKLSQQQSQAQILVSLQDQKQQQLQFQQQAQAQQQLQSQAQAQQYQQQISIHHPSYPQSFPIEHQQTKQPTPTIQTTPPPTYPTRPRQSKTTITPPTPPFIPIPETERKKKKPPTPTQYRRPYKYQYRKFNVMTFGKALHHKQFKKPPKKLRI